MKLSGSIIAFNEEANIERAVSSLDFCDEVVVVDSGSSDRTREIATSLGARVIVADWPGFAKQKNFAGQSAAHEWILSIDADEEVSAKLAAEIKSIFKSPTDHVGFDFPRLAQYQGAWIRHSGWYPDRKVRLYNRHAARWVGDYVHESVQVAGPVGHLNGDLLHYTCNSNKEHLETLERYTDLAARELRDGGLPVSAHKLLVSPGAAFIRSYVWKLGVLDGSAGFTIAKMAALYAYKKYAKARNLVG